MFKNFAVNNSGNYYGDETYDNLLNIMVNFEEVSDSYLINIYNLNNESEFNVIDSSSKFMSLINFCKKKNGITKNITLSSSSSSSVENVVVKNEAVEEKYCEHDEGQELYTTYLENNSVDKKQQEDDVKNPSIKNDKITDVCFLHNEHYLLTFMDLLIPFTVEKLTLESKNYMVDDKNNMLITIVAQKIMLNNAKEIVEEESKECVTLTTSYFDNNLLIHSGSEHEYSNLPINSNKKPIIFYLKDY